MILVIPFLSRISLKFIEGSNFHEIGSSRTDEMNQHKLDPRCLVLDAGKSVMEGTTVIYGTANQSFVKKIGRSKVLSAI